MVRRAETPITPRQRSPRTDPDLRDGDSGHGNPGEPAGDLNTLDSDTDVGDGDGRVDSLTDFELDDEYENAPEDPEEFEA